MSAASVKFLEPIDFANLPFAAVVGIDWADQKHDVCLVQPRSKPELSVVTHSPTALLKWATDLWQRFEGRTIAVCIEQSRGPLINALEQFDFLAIYPVNPQAMSNFRKTFFVSGSKSDPIDAAMLARLFCIGYDRLKPLTQETPQTQLLEGLTRERRKQVDRRTALVNELMALLKSYYPLALEMCGDKLYSEMALTFLTKYPTHKKLMSARPSTIQQFYTRHHLRSAEKIKQRLAAMQAAKPLTSNPAIIELAQLQLQALVGQLREVNKAIDSYEQALPKTLMAHPDAFIFGSLPGAGTINSARLIAAFGTCRERWAESCSIQNYSGIAPVQRSSGKSRSVHKRVFFPAFVHQTFYEFAGCSIRSCAWASQFYHQMRCKGKNHATALRALAYKWTRIIWRMWQNRQPYDEQRYIASLRSRGSTLLVANESPLTKPQSLIGPG